MPSVTDHNESNFARLEREDAERAQRTEIAPRLKVLEGRSVMYYDRAGGGGGWHCGYLLQVGEVNCAVQPLAPIGGALSPPVRVDIIDVKAEPVMTKLATIDEYIKAKGFDVAPEAPKRLDPVVKKERKAKVKVQPDEAAQIKLDAAAGRTQSSKANVANAPKEKTPVDPAALEAAFKLAVAVQGNSCKNGHLYTIDIIYIGTLMNKGKLGCKTCDQMRKGEKK